MNIKSSATVLATSFHKAFPRSTYPAYTHTDLIYSTHPVNWGTDDGFLAIPEAEIIVSAPMKVWHNNILAGQSFEFGDNSYPQIVWTPGEENDSQDMKVAFNLPQYFTEVVAPTNTATVSESTKLQYQTNIDCQGFTFLTKRTDDTDANNAGNQEANQNTTTNPKWILRFGVGSNHDCRYYQMTLTFAGVCEIGYWDKETKKVDIIKKIDFASDASKVLKGSHSTDQEYTMVEVMLMAGKLFIAAGSEVVKIMLNEARFDDDGLPISKFSWAEFSSGQSATCQFSIHPIKFRSKAQLTSQQFPIGFRADRLPSWEILAATGWESLIDPNDMAISVEPVPSDDDSNSLLGPICQYMLFLENANVSGTFKGIDYSDFAVGVKGVAFYWARGPAITEYAPVYNWEPETVTVSQVFDLNQLTIRSSASLKFNDWHGGWANWSQWTGHVGLQVALGKYHYANGATVFPGFGDSDEIVFSGIGHTKGTAQAGDEYHFIVECEDRVKQLQSPRWSLPWMDGWNSFYAIAFLAQLGGVTLEQMAFRNYVPSDPYTDLGDPSNPIGFFTGQGAYFLPVGYYSSQLTRFSGQSLWQIMERIAQSIGYMLFFDRFGMLHFEKFNLPFMLENQGLFRAKRTFDESDAHALIYNGEGSAGMWNMTWRKNMDTVRNKVIIVGIDAFHPAWRPIVVSLTDKTSIDLPIVPNFLGYVEPFVWADNQFASPEYAYKAAITQLMFMRIPESNISFSTWFQPDIFPLDIIKVNSIHAGNAGRQVAPPGSNKFLVVSVTHNITKQSGVGSTSITALGLNQFDSWIGNGEGIFNGGPMARSSMGNFIGGG